MKMLNTESMVIIFATTILLASVGLSSGQVTLPSMVTIPPDAPLASGTTTNFSMYVMTVYDEACVNQSESTDNSTSSDSDDSTISQWTQSQYVVYIGAVALNNNNTCQVVCQVQTLKQFAIMFGSDIRTRSVLVGRVYMANMSDDTSCWMSGSQGVCMAGECVPGGDDTNSTTTMMPETTTETMDNTTTDATMMPESTTGAQTNDSASVSSPTLI